MAKSAKIGKAQKAAQAVKGEAPLRKRKMRTSIRFRRPVTRNTPSQPRLARSPASTVAHREKTPFDYNTILLHPLPGDKNTQKMERENIIVFAVAPRANKKQIAEAFAKLHKAPVRSVNTMNTFKGGKKAYIRLRNDKEALNLATKLGVL